MTPEHWRQIRDLFAAVAELSAGERDCFLAASGCDDAVRDEVLHLLAAHDRAEGFMGRPALIDFQLSAEAENETPSPEFIGRRLGKYQVVHEIGRGAMGVVYLAERADGKFQKQVAIKLLRHGPDNRGAAQRFQQEGQVLARLEHPNITRLLDADATEDGRPYFVMEYAEGESLRQRLKQRGALPAAEAVEIAKQLCAGLAAAHRLGVVHRDLKPSNLMIREQDGALAVKLLDFGIARLSAAEIPGTQTQSGAILGTAAYLSPEQAAGATGEKIDARADVYSLGMVVYEMLTGHTAFQGESLLEVLQKHQVEAPLPPSRLRPELRIPAALDRAVLKALAKDRAARQQSVSDLAAELETALQTAPDSQPTRPTRKAAGWTFGLLAAAAMLALGLWQVRANGWFAPPSGNLRTPATASPSPQSVSLLRYRVLKKLRGGEPVSLDAENTVQTGDRIWFEFNLARRGALYLLYQQQGGTLAWLNPASGSASGIQPAESWIRIPAGQSLEMDNRKGAQKYWLVYVGDGDLQPLWPGKPAIRRGQVPHAVLSPAASIQLLDRLRRETVALTETIEQTGERVVREFSLPEAVNRPALHLIELHQVR